MVRAYAPSDLRRTAEIQLLRRDFIKGVRREPATAEMLDAFPDLGDALIAAMETQIDTYISEFDERFFPRATQIVVKSLSRDDVINMTAFYRSTLGRKILASSAAKADGSEIIDRAITGQAIDAGVVKRQALRAGLATYGILLPQERDQVSAMGLSPSGQHFSTVIPALASLQAELISNPGPKFTAGAKAAMGAAFKRIIGTDPFSQK